MPWCKQARIAGGRKWRVRELCRSAHRTSPHFFADGDLLCFHATPKQQSLNHVGFTKDSTNANFPKSGRLSRNILGRDLIRYID
jgi:hypothetical protein